jgi:hypothetical protein
MNTASSPVLAYLKNAAFYEVQATGQMAVCFRIKDDSSAAQRLIMAILLGRAGRQPLGGPNAPLVPQTTTDRGHLSRLTDNSHRPGRSPKHQRRLKLDGAG